jgi:hypothetical protein
MLASVKCILVVGIGLKKTTFLKKKGMALDFMGGKVFFSL